MATSAAPGPDRAHAAAKRYIYAWGGGRAEGDATMRDLLGGKGAGLAEMTNAGLPVPPGFTITTEACNDYFAAGEQLPDGLWDDVLEAVSEVERRDRQGLRRPGQPAARERPLGRQVLDARDDGHGPQPRPQRADARGPDRAHRQRALRLGRVPALHPDVRPDRDGRARRAVRPCPRRGQGARAAPRRTPTSTPPRCATLVDEFKAIVRADTGRDFPSDPYEQLDLAIKAVFASWFGKRARDYRKYHKIAARPGHGRERRDDGLRQHGRRLGHRRRVHARPEHRREGALRRVPDQRPGRGRRGRHPDARRRSPRCTTDMPEVYAEFQRIGQQLERHYRDVQDLEFTIERGRLYMLQTRSRQADRGRGRADRRRHGRRGHHHQGRGVARIEPAHVDQLLRDQFDPRRAQERHAHRQGPQRLAGRGRRAGRVRRRHRGRMGRARREGRSSSASRPRPTTSTAWPSPRASSPPAAAPPRTPRSSPARSASRASPARADLVVDYAGKQRALQRSPASSSRKATGSASTARPATSSSARCRPSRPASRTSPSSRRSSAGPTRSAG